MEPRWISQVISWEPRDSTLLLLSMLPLVSVIALGTTITLV